MEPLSYIEVVRLANIAVLIAIIARFTIFLLHYRARREYALKKFPVELWDDSWMMWKGIWVVFTLIGCGFGYSLYMGFPPNPVTSLLLPALVYAGVGIHRFANTYEWYLLGGKEKEAEEAEIRAQDDLDES